MNLYIHGAGLLSAAGSNNEDTFLKDAIVYNTDRLLCKEPDYSAYIPPMQLRRMSKAVRMGIGAAKICLQQNSDTKTDAISVGTALGCLQDTETFLNKMISQDEQMLTPTAFIQSTHNTVAGQVALVMGCHGHNLTYAHRGHSFEHAMLNTWLYLSDHPGKKVLVGGIEELTETSMDVLKQLNIYAKQEVTSDRIFDEPGKGSIAGEGAAFFLVTDQQKDGANFLVNDILTFTAKDADTVLHEVNAFMSSKQLQVDDIDLVVLGINGDEQNEALYGQLRQDIFKNNSQAAFKHICGEYPVASAFALGLIAQAVQYGIPSSVLLNHPPKQLKRILLINNFVRHFSCWLLQVV